MSILSRLKLGKTELSMLALIGLIGSYDIFILLVGFNNPLVDIHSFRQTQTALTSYWMIQGGPWLAYETPVLGAPWVIPFEFPIYQWITVVLAKLGLPLDAAGRLTSFVFFFSCLWPLQIIYKRLNFGTYAYFATTALFLASPIYIYWGRTFMIETSALFFGLFWLALFVEYVNRPNWSLFVGTLVIGIIGILTKSTTYPAFALLGGLYFVYSIYLEWKSEKKFGTFFRWVLLVMLLVLPFIPAFLWIDFTDALKMDNPIGPRLTSAALSAWNYGTIEQRVSLDLWQKTIASRVLPDIFGYGIYLIYAFIIAIFVSCRLRTHLSTPFSKGKKWYVWVTLFAFLLPFLLFTKLHMVHNYYQTANALFLVATVGLTLAIIAKAGHKHVATGLVLLIVIGQLTFFHNNFYSWVTRSDSSWKRIAETAKSMTPPDSSLIVVGIDWSSLIAYYSQRKSLTMPNWTPDELVDRVIADPQQFLGSRELSGLVICEYPSAKRLIDKIRPLLETRTAVAREGVCVFYQ